MRIAVCDDEKPFRKILIEKINGYARRHKLDFVIDEYCDGKELVTSELTYDCIFIDYQMKEYNGMDTVSVFRNRNDDVIVIFVSSFPEIVFESMKVNTFRFLVKPIDDSELEEALSSCIKTLTGDNYLLLNDYDTNQKHRINQKDIIYCEADNFYTRVRVENGFYRFNGTLSDLETELILKCFFRTHRSYIVNVRFIDTYSKSEIIFTNGEKALLTKKKYFDFQKHYVLFIKNGGI